MFPREEFLPSFIRFSNLLYRDTQGWSQEDDFEAVQEQVGQAIVELKARLAWDLPLLSAFKEGPAAAEQVAQTLEGLESLVAQPLTADLLSAYEARQEEFLNAMMEAGSLRELLPVFTDVRIVNELMLLATAHFEGRIDREPIRGRLPVLLDWIERKTADWKTYTRLFPDEQPIAALEAIRVGAGGIHLYLSEEAEQGLKEGLDIIIKALKALATAEEARFLTETKRVEFSPDLRLERVWRGADWNSWEGTSLPAELLQFYQESIKRAFRLAQQTLMPVSMLETKMSTAADLQERLADNLETLIAHQNVPEGEPARPPRAQALANLETARRDLESQFQEISRFVEQQRPLEVIPLYANLVGTMVGIFNQTTPDSQLHALLDIAVKSQASFMETFEQSAQEFDGDTDQQEALEHSWEALGQQGHVYELLWEYLQSGNRLILHEAYESLAEPFGVLAAFAAPEEADSTHHIGEITCPFCSEQVVLDAGKCPECRRMVDVSASERVSTVTLATEAPANSNVISILDQRTAGLTSAENREVVSAEWRDLAARLESLGQSAIRDGISGTEPLLSSLVKSCHQVADGLETAGFDYRSIRGSLMARFQQLEQTAGNAK